mgnify:FL=1
MKQTKLAKSTKQGNKCYDTEVCALAASKAAIQKCSAKNAVKSQVVVEDKK